MKERFKWVKIAGLVVVSLVLLFFALLGYLYSTRGTPTLAVRVLGLPPAVHDSAFLRTVELLTKTNLQLGHRIEVLFDGDGTFPRVWQDIRAARATLFLQIYYGKPGAVADSLKRVLRESAQRGVRVFVLFDAFGSSDLSDEYMDSLRAAGARVTEFRPLKWHTLHQTQSRSHVRLLVIDGAIAYTGGFGIDDLWLGNGHTKDQWRETNVRFSGPAVRQAQAAFATAWAEATGELLTGPMLFSTTPPGDTTKTAAGLLYGEPSLGSTAAERFLALTVSSARRRLYITNAYFVPDADFRHMLRVAAQRGVDVRVLTAGKETDIKSVRLAARRRYEELLRAGVRIYEYRPTMIHAKTIVADDSWSTIGTMNFDNRSLAFNDESNLLIHDRAVASVLTRKFEDDLRFSQEIVLRNFERRSWFTKLLERGAGVFAKML